MAATIANLDMVSGTEAGREWLLKALHPAEPTVTGTQLPDGSELDTVPLELTMTYTLGPTATYPAAAAWGAQISLLPSTVPLAVFPTGGLAGMPAFNLRYPQISAAIPVNDFGTFMASVEAFRLTFASVTMHLDANATTDQGTIVACQQITKPFLMFQSQGAGIACPPVAGWNYSVPFTTQDVPGYDQIMAMPRAYQANLRDGAYMPLRLSQTSQHWFSLREGCSNVWMNQTTNPASQQWKLPLTVGHDWPYWSYDHAYINGGNVLAPMYCPMLSETVGHLVLANVHPSSNVVIKVRTGLELKVQTQSPYLPYSRPSADIDATAIEAYYRIVRQLEDCYPASYNANGDILKFVAKAVRTVAPFLRGIPTVGDLVYAASEPAAKLLDWGAARVAAGPNGRVKSRKKNPGVKKGKQKVQGIPKNKNTIIMVPGNGDVLKTGKKMQYRRQDKK